MTTDVTAVPPTTPATVDSGALVGNPRRTRGLDASVVRPGPATSDLVGNPRRTRGLDAAVTDAA
ncbi:MAG TPA: hypothetical protein VIJ00_10250 [Nakamurella sp.]|jgi:hypothetical protein